MLLEIIQLYLLGKKDMCHLAIDSAHPQLFVLCPTIALQLEIKPVLAGNVWSWIQIFTN